MFHVGTARDVSTCGGFVVSAVVGLLPVPLSKSYYPVLCKSAIVTFLLLFCSLHVLVCPRVLSHLLIVSGLPSLELLPDCFFQECCNVLWLETEFKIVSVVVDVSSKELDCLPNSECACWS